MPFPQLLDDHGSLHDLELAQRRREETIFARLGRHEGLFVRRARWHLNFDVEIWRSESVIQFGAIDQRQFHRLTCLDRDGVWREGQIVPGFNSIRGIFSCARNHRRRTKGANAYREQ